MIGHPKEICVSENTDVKEAAPVKTASEAPPAPVAAGEGPGAAPSSGGEGPGPATEGGEQGGQRGDRHRRFY